MSTSNQTSVSNLKDFYLNAETEHDFSVSLITAVIEQLGCNEFAKKASEIHHKDRTDPYKEQITQKVITFEQGCHFYQANKADIIDWLEKTNDALDFYDTVGDLLEDNVYMFGCGFIFGADKINGFIGSCDTQSDDFLKFANAMSCIAIHHFSCAFTDYQNKKFSA